MLSSRRAVPETEALTPVAAFTVLIAEAMLATTVEPPAMETCCVPVAVDFERDVIDGADKRAAGITEGCGLRALGHADDDVGRGVGGKQRGVDLQRVESPACRWS